MAKAVPKQAHHHTQPPHMHSWTVSHFTRLFGAFKASIKCEPLIPSGAPPDFVPAATDP
jgi:hypothetical protein